MTEPIRANVNGFALTFWDGHEFGQASPLIYTLSINGEGFGDGFDPHALPYGDGILVARRTKNFWGLGFAVFRFDPGTLQFRKMSKVLPVISLRAVGDGYVEAATIAYGDYNVRRIELKN